MNVITDVDVDVDVDLMIEILHDPMYYILWGP